MTVPNRKSPPPGLLPRWHPPKIVDLGIRVPPKKNTWRNFLNRIDEHFTSHQTFPVVYPEVKLIERSTIRSCLRMRELRERERVAKGNRRLTRVRFRQVPLPEWLINKFEAELKTKQGDATIMDREWDRQVNLAIAEFVISRFKK